MNCIIAQLLPEKKDLKVKSASKNFFGPYFDSQAVDLGVCFFATVIFMNVKEKKNLETMSYTV